MNPQNANTDHHDDSQSVDRIPARTLLEALARIYQLVLVTDSEGVVLWKSDELSKRFGSATFCVGQSAQAIIPHLPPFLKPEQTFALRSKMRGQGFVSNERLEFAVAGEESTSVEVNIVTVSTRNAERPFYVVIARPVGDEEQTARPTTPTQDEYLAPVLDNSPDAMLVSLVS